MGTATAQDIIAMKNKLIQACLDLASMQSWSDVSMDDIANRADVDFDNAMALCPDKDSLFMAYGRQVDLKVAEAFDGEAWDGMSDKDRLFDVLMERFDVLNENRAGVISIINAITLDPKQMICLSPMVCQSMEQMMRVACVDHDGWKGAIKLTALSGVYLKSLRDWVKDDTADMSMTMASVDKGLGYLNKINI